MRGWGYARPMAGPELSVVCRNCGSEVSPYVTECPYCGTRIRKRAPKLQREGDEIRIREGRRERKARRAAGRRDQAAARASRVEVEDLSQRPVATGLLLAAAAVVYVLARSTTLDLGVILGPVDGDVWRYLTAPFYYDDAGYLFVCAAAIAIFLPPIERRVGAFPALLLALACGGLGMLAAGGLDSVFGDGIPIAAGGNGIALGCLAAYVMIREPERRADPEEGYDPFAVAVAAAVLLLLPLVEDFADPWAGIVGGLVGAACGFSAAIGQKRAR
jgi:membrane associated rhomboid family serine protease